MNPNGDWDAPALFAQLQGSIADRLERIDAEQKRVARLADQLKEREAGLKSREQDLAARSDQFSVQISAQKTEVARREKDICLKEKALQEREKAFQSRQGELKKQEQEIQRQLQVLKGQEVTVDRRLDELEAAHKLLVAQLESYTKQHKPRQEGKVKRELQSEDNPASGTENGESADVIDITSEPEAEPGTLEADPTREGSDANSMPIPGSPLADGEELHGTAGEAPAQGEGSESRPAENAAGNGRLKRKARPGIFSEPPRPSTEEWRHTRADGSSREESLQRDNRGGAYPPHRPESAPASPPESRAADTSAAAQEASPGDDLGDERGRGASRGHRGKRKGRASKQSRGREAQGSREGSLQRDPLRPRSTQLRHQGEPLLRSKRLSSSNRLGSLRQGGHAEVLPYLGAKPPARGGFRPKFPWSRSGNDQQVAADAASLDAAVQQCRAAFFGGEPQGAAAQKEER